MAWRCNARSAEQVRFKGTKYDHCTACLDNCPSQFSLNAAICSNIDNPNRELLNAATIGNISGVEILLQCYRTDINCVDMMNMNGWTSLMIASNYGHLKVVEVLLLHSQIDINMQSIKVSEYQGVSGVTALICASWRGNTEITKLLLNQSNIDVNKADNNGRTALYTASQSGYPEVVRLLVEYPSIDVNYIRPGEFSALWKASEKWRVNIDTGGRYLEVVKLLLDHPEIMVTKGKTVDEKGWLELGELLYYHEINELGVNQRVLVASVIGNKTNVEILLKINGMDINASDGGGRTPLLWASKNGLSDIVKLFLGQPSIDVNKARTTDGENALLLASYNGHSEVVQQLLNVTEIDINHVDSHGRTALSKASQVGHSHVTDFLIAHYQIDINKAEPKQGETPLYMASKNGHLIIVGQLLGQAMIYVNKATINRETPLMAACKSGHSEVVDNLLRHPTIDVNFAAFGGKSAIFNAFYESTVEENKQHKIVELMVQCPSVDMLMRDEEGLTALDYAKQLNRTDIVAAFGSQFKLRKSGHTCCSGKVNDGLQIAAEFGDLTMVAAFLLCKQVDLNVGYKYGRTPLYMASMMNHTGVVELLLTDLRTDVNIVVNSENALFTASEKGYLKIVTLLLSHRNIDVNAINTRSRKNSLIISSDEGHLQIVRALLHNPQTFVNEIDLYGMSALNTASNKGYLRIVKLLFRCPKTDVSQIKAESYGPDIIEALRARSTLTGIGLTCCENVKDSLMEAAWLGDFRAIRGLIQCPDVDVNAIDNRGRTPLFIASWRGHIRAVEVLLNTTGIEDVGVYIGGATPFSIASEKNHFKIMEQLIDHENTNMNKGWCSDNWAPGLLICQSTTTSNGIQTATASTSSGFKKNVTYIHCKRIFSNED